MTLLRLMPQLALSDEKAGLSRFHEQVLRQYKLYPITFCLAFLKGKWSGTPDGGMEAFSIVISFCLYPEIV